LSSSGVVHSEGLLEPSHSSYDDSVILPLVSTLPRDAIESVEKLADRLAETQKARRQTEVSLRRAIRMASKNGDLASAIIAADPSRGRQAVNDTLRALERQRHETRRVVFAVALEEGMSIGKLGRLWGFSRQLAQRYAKEARCDSTPNP
jgi:hypothetical protein